MPLCGREGSNGAFGSFFGDPLSHDGTVGTKEVVSGVIENALRGLGGSPPVEEDRVGESVCGIGGGVA